jgi:solute carrier family 29 (equilibrative nucleoside transporter), member 1/2/3
MANRKEDSDSLPTYRDTEKVSHPLLDKSESPNAIVNKSDSDELNDTSIIIRDGGSPDGFVKDKYYLVYMIFLLFGIASLLPWNIFITATSYFVDFKLNTNQSYNATYRKDFTFYIGIIGQTTNVFMNLLNILVTFGGNPKNRIPYTFILCSVVIIFHVALAIVDSSSWPLAFFILCAVSVFVMYIATGIMNSCIYFVASIFPFEYLNAIILGTNLAGIFTTVMSIISKATSPNLRIAAIYYFLSAFVVLMMGFIGYFVMHKTVRKNLI